MDNVIDIRKHGEIDPILRRGDLVKLVDISELEDEWTEGLLDVVAIVVGISMVYPDDHDIAPGQAARVNLAFPFDDGEWEQIEDVSTQSVHRLIGPDSYDLRGFHQGRV